MDLDLPLGADPEEHPVEGGVVDLAEREAVRRHRRSATRAGPDVGRVEEAREPQSAEGAGGAAGVEHPFPERRLREPGLALAGQQPVDKTPRMGIRLSKRWGTPVVRADAGRFPHRVAARIAGATRSARFRGEGGPSPHPSPAALRAASAREGLCPQPVRYPRRAEASSEARSSRGSSRIPGSSNWSVTRRAPGSAWTTNTGNRTRYRFGSNRKKK